MTELLTDRDHEMIRQLGQMYMDFKHILGPGVVAKGDLGEVARHIHALQHMVMAQAAARAYPDKYRMLGNQMED